MNNEDDVPKSGEAEADIPKRGSGAHLFLGRTTRDAKGDT